MMLFPLLKSKPQEIVDQFKKLSSNISLTESIGKE